MSVVVGNLPSPYIRLMHYTFGGLQAKHYRRYAHTRGHGHELYDKRSCRE